MPAAVEGVILAAKALLPSPEHVCVLLEVPLMPGIGGSNARAPFGSGAGRRDSCEPLGLRLRDGRPARGPRPGNCLSAHLGSRFPEVRIRRATPEVVDVALQA